MEDITRQDVIDFVNETSINMFGKFTEEIGGLIADEVIEEYNEAGDGDLQKAISYVIGDKFGMFEGL